MGEVDIMANEEKSNETGMDARSEFDIAKASSGCNGSGRLNVLSSKPSQPNAGMPSDPEMSENTGSAGCAGSRLVGEDGRLSWLEECGGVADGAGSGACGGWHPCNLRGLRRGRGDQVGRR
jgi:hypothetical protein